MIRVDSDGVIQEGVFIRTPYNYSMDSASAESGLVCPEPTLAQQQFRDEVDINTIVRRFGVGGVLPNSFAAPQYVDYHGITDFQSAMNAVVDAERNFMRLPAETRAYFQNDPQQLLAFLDDEGNRDTAEKLGLVAKRPVVNSDGLPADPDKRPVGSPALTADELSRIRQEILSKPMPAPTA